MTPLLREREEAWIRQREVLRAEVRELLRAALAELAPGEEVIVFGSLVYPGKFNSASDVDIAFVEEPRQASQCRLISQFEERLKRPVDVVLLQECRLREKIEREGERWIG